MHEAHFHIHLTLVYLHLLLFLQFVRFYLHVRVVKRCVYVRKAGTMERYWGGEFDHFTCTCMLSTRQQPNLLVQNSTLNVTIGNLEIHL